MAVWFDGNVPFPQIPDYNREFALAQSRTGYGDGSLAVWANRGTVPRLARDGLWSGGLRHRVRRADL